MVPSSADIVIQNRRMSQSETSAITVRDVVNIISSQRAWVGGDQNVTSPVLSYCSITETFRYISTNEPCRAFGRHLVILLWFYYLVDKSSEFPGGRLATMNAVYL